MLKSKQYILIASVGLLMVGLYSLDIKGLVKPNENEGMQATAEQSPATEVSAELISTFSKQSINESLAKDIQQLEDQLKNASEEEKLAINKQLALKWDDVNQPAAAAFVYEQIASTESNLTNWLTTGDRFTEGYQNYGDTTATAALINKATNAYNQALSIDKNSLAAKTGLGIAYVNAGQNPMQGIKLLLDVVKQDPENIKANMNLGLFSMKSGQFDKAVNRFKTVIAKAPTPEVWFYLATSYENQGLKSDAILAYQKSKELAADQSLSNFVDKKINELSK